MVISSKNVYSLFAYQYTNCNVSVFAVGYLMATFDIETV
jgi:hypothetical protein